MGLLFKESEFLLFFNLSIPAHAIIIALSTHNFFSGTINSTEFFLHKKFNFSRINLFYATPPANTNEVIFFFFLNKLIAFSDFINNISVIHS